MNEAERTEMIVSDRQGKTGLDEARAAVIRDRIARGFYRTEWAQRQIAARILGSGDASECPDR